MSLKTPDDLQTLDYVDLGQPFCIIVAKSGIDTTTLDYVWNGQPFYAAAPAAAGYDATKMFAMF